MDARDPIAQMHGHAAEHDQRREELRYQAEQLMAAAQAEMQRYMAEATAKQNAILAQAEEQAELRDWWRRKASEAESEAGLPVAGQAPAVQDGGDRG